MASIYFEYWKLSLSCIDLDFILGKVEILFEYDMNIDDDKNFIPLDKNLVTGYENLIPSDENFVPDDENFILTVIGNFITVISNVSDVFNNILNVFQKLFAQVEDCSFLNAEVFEEI